MILWTTRTIFEIRKRINLSNNWKVFILLTPHINAHQSAKPRHVCTIFLQSWISYLVKTQRFYLQNFLWEYMYLRWNENILKVNNKWINKARKYILNFKKETIYYKVEGYPCKHIKKVLTNISFIFAAFAMSVVAKKFAAGTSETGIMFICKCTKILMMAVNKLEDKGKKTEKQKFICTNFILERNSNK